MANQPVTWDGLDAQGNPLHWDTPVLTWDFLVPGPITTPKPMPQLRVFLGFTSASDPGVIEITESVLTNLYGQAAYSPP